MTSGRTVEIAGAGFAGLTAAAALARRGWNVRVHERNAELRAEGAGILLWGNSLAVIEDIGALPDLMANSMTPPCYETRMNNVVVSQEHLDGIRWRTQTRPHLFHVLLEAARNAGAEIRTGSEVVGADADGTVEFADGERVRADLVLGADGAGSTVREAVGIPFVRERSRDGISRFLVPRRKTDLQAMEAETEWDNMIDFWNGDDVGLRVLYTPCNDDEVYLALMAAATNERASRVPIDLPLWTSVFPHLAPVLEEVATTEGRYYGYQTTRLERWVQGRVALVGDAAHAMCPALAQGAGCAMTNAWTLADAVTRAADVGDLPAVLRRWEARERPITDRTQDRSQWYAESRSMREGDQFVGTSVEMALYDPTDPGRREELYV